MFCSFLNPIALRKTKIVYNFGLSECNRAKLLGTKVSELVVEPGLCPPSIVGGCCDQAMALSNFSAGASY